MQKNFFAEDANPDDGAKLHTGFQGRSEGVTFQHKLFALAGNDCIKAIYQKTK